MEIIDDGVALRMGYVAPVFVACFYGPPTMTVLESLFAYEKSVVGPDAPFCAISIVDPGVGRDMNSQARGRAREIAEFFGERMLCSVTVVEGAGFFPAMVRSILAGIQLLSRRSESLRVVSSLDEAVAHVTEKSRAARVPIDGTAVTNALATLVAPRRKSA